MKDVDTHEDRIVDGAATGADDDRSADDDVSVDDTPVEGATIGEVGAVPAIAVAVPAEPPAPPERGWGDRWRELRGDLGALLRTNAGSIGLGLTLAGIVVWAAVFSILGVRHHRNFGTWAFDMAIYDQAFWLVSRGGQTFMTVRGMDVWGHHVNLIAYLFAPFYRWFGAGPELLYVVQNVTLALGALPTYLIAKDRFGGSTRWWTPYVGLAFAAAYLLYAPTQFVAWINFHPEALVITPFLFAWYFGQRKRWGWFFTFVLVALAMREDTALAVIMLGVVLVVLNRNSANRRRDLQMSALTVVLGVVWYVVATQVVIRYFNAGEPPFYLEYFYRRYGGSFSGIFSNSLRHPNWVISDATQPDRLRFYRDLGLPFGGLSLASPLHLLMAVPQLLASVIGDQVYARQILYQYTSVMIAPIVIAAIEGARNVWRWRPSRKWLLPWLLVCAYVTNVAWSPSPIGERYGVWAQDNPRRETFEEALALVPDDASVTSSYSFGPHLSSREVSYDWPNPFAPAYWGNDAFGNPDCERYPSASDVEYLVVDRSLFGNVADPATAAQAQLIDGLTADGGQFEVLFDEQLPAGDGTTIDGVVVGRRVEPGPDGERLPPNCPGTVFEALVLNEIEPPAPPDSTGATLPATPGRDDELQAPTTTSAG